MPPARRTPPRSQLLEPRNLHSGAPSTIQAQSTELHPVPFGPITPCDRRNMGDPWHLSPALKQACSTAQPRLRGWERGRTLGLAARSCDGGGEGEVGKEAADPAHGRGGYTSKGLRKRSTRRRAMGSEGYGASRRRRRRRHSSPSRNLRGGEVATLQSAGKLPASATRIRT